MNNCDCPTTTDATGKIVYVKGSECAKKDPCDEIKKQLNNPEYKTKFDAINNSTTFKMKAETGFNEIKTNGVSTFNDLDVVSNSGGHSLSFKTSGAIGATHVHLDDLSEEEKKNIEGDNFVDRIRIFSPTDIVVFLRIAYAASFTPNMRVEETYLTMLSSTGNYTLKYSGDINNITNFNTSNLQKLKAKYKRQLMYAPDSRIELKFLKFIKKEMNINGEMLLYKINSDGSVEKRQLSEDEKTTIGVPCN